MRPTQQGKLQLYGKQYAYMSAAGHMQDISPTKSKSTCVSLCVCVSVCVCHRSGILRPWQSPRVRYAVHDSYLV